ncbi:MAG: DHH family phosphoesterase [Deltaproteobacteria bacterium]|nr:DHH family phosphoesterase [Deltaproteobacteria bacterium]MBW2067845.1 DHH family phosphoesterase [Deltaproteobacteria bacterium]
MNVSQLKSRKARLNAFLDIFQHDDRVVVVIDADPDAIGSAWGIKRLLWRHVACTTIVAIRPIRRLNNISLVRLLRIPIEYLDEDGDSEEFINLEKFTKRILVDGQPYHNDIFRRIDFDVVIDHHPIPEKSNIFRNSMAFIDIRPSYGSTSTILTEYLRAAQIKPSASLATALLYGIKTDTRNFERHTVEEDIRAFLYLYPLANHNVLTKIEISDISLRDLEFFEEALRRRIVAKNKILTYVGRVDSPDILVVISEFFLKVYDISWSIAAGISDSTLVVVARSDGYRKNAGKALERSFASLGSAGGHAAMARAEVPIDKLLEHMGKLRLNRRTVENFLIKHLL